MFAKNLQELGTNPFPYIVLVLPRPLPAELIKGEHFILADLLKLILGSFSQADFDLEPLVWSDYLPFFVKDPKPAPQAAKGRKKKKENKAGRGLGGVC